MGKLRLEILDIMQGLAMLLVILGHHYFSFSPKWYKDFHLYLYSFHMPLFIFISGFLIMYSYKHLNSFRDYIIYVKKRFIKFSIPYFLIGLIVIFLSNSFSDWNGIIRDIGYLVYSPKQGPAIFLWYIYLLLFFYIISPIIIKYNNTKMRFLFLIIGIVGYYNQISVPYFCMDYFSKYFIFYYLGLSAVRFFENIKYVKKYILMIFVCLFIFSSYFWFQNNTKICTFLLSLFSIPTTYFIAKCLSKTDIIKLFFIFVSKNCFTIYLLHMFFVQGLSYLYANKNLYIPYILYLIFSSLLSIYFSYIITLLYKRLKMYLIKEWC